MDGTESGIFCPILSYIPGSQLLIMGIMPTSLAPGSQEASKVDPFTQRMIHSTLEFRGLSKIF